MNIIIGRCIDKGSRKHSIDGNDLHEHKKKNSDSKKRNKATTDSSNPFSWGFEKDVTVSFITGWSMDTGLIVVSTAMCHSRKISTPLAAFRRERTVAHTISHEQSYIRPSHGIGFI